MIPRNFPKPAQQGEMKWVTVYMDADLFNRVRELALEEERPMTNTISILIKRALKQGKPQ